MAYHCLFHRRRSDLFDICSYELFSRLFSVAFCSNISLRFQKQLRSNYWCCQCILLRNIYFRKAERVFSTFAGRRFVYDFDDAVLPMQDLYHRGGRCVGYLAASSEEIRTASVSVCIICIFNCICAGTAEHTVPFHANRQI